MGGGGNRHRDCRSFSRIEALLSCVLANRPYKQFRMVELTSKMNSAPKTTPRNNVVCLVGPASKGITVFGPHKRLCLTTTMLKIKGENEISMHFKSQIQNLRKKRVYGVSSGLTPPQKSKVSIWWPYKRPF